jgi:hypothetical protein
MRQRLDLLPAIPAEGRSREFLRTGHDQLARPVLLQGRETADYAARRPSDPPSGDRSVHAEQSDPVKI